MSNLKQSKAINTVTAILGIVIGALVAVVGVVVTMPFTVLKNEWVTTVSGLIQNAYGSGGVMVAQTKAAIILGNQNFVYTINDGFSLIIFGLVFVAIWSFLLWLAQTEGNPIEVKELV